MPRFVDVGGAPPRRRRVRNLLEQETVPMTVLAQDPSVADLHGPVLVQIPVPADRLQRGPRSHRFHVVDVERRHQRRRSSRRYCTIAATPGRTRTATPPPPPPTGWRWSATATSAPRTCSPSRRTRWPCSNSTSAGRSRGNRRAPQLFLVPQARSRRTRGTPGSTTPCCSGGCRDRRRAAGVHRAVL